MRVDRRRRQVPDRIDECIEIRSRGSDHRDKDKPPRERSSRESESPGKRHKSMGRRQRHCGALKLEREEHCKRALVEGAS
jgi:hypothetical protein